MATLLERHKPEYRRLDSLADRQETVVLKERCFLVAKACRNVFAFFLGEDNPIERLI